MKPGAERRAEARAEQASRLLGAARAMRPAVKVTLPEIRAAIRARRYTSMYSVGQVAAVFTLVLCPVLAVASVAVSRGWWGRHEPAPATSISVPARATAHIGRRGKFVLSLTGPSRIEVPPDNDDQPIRLEAGQLIVSNEGRAVEGRTVEVFSGGHRVEIAPATTVSIGVTADTGVRVTSMSGPAPRVDGVTQSAPAAAVGLERSPATTMPAVTRRVATAPIVAVAPVAAPAAPDPTVAHELLRPPPHARPASPSPAADELGIVHDALERLRGDKNGVAALHLLDEYDRRFPEGMLRDEATLIRIEALLALGRTVEALDRLDAMPPTLLDRSPRLRVARGELRAARGLCSGAVADFAAAASAGAGADIERRIERGRAACNLADHRHTGQPGDNR